MMKIRVFDAISYLPNSECQFQSDAPTQEDQAVGPTNFQGFPSSKTSKLAGLLLAVSLKWLTQVAWLSLFVAFSSPALAQHAPEQANSSAVKTQNKVVIITGARFSYPLVQKWIDDFNRVNPGVQIIIESRGSADPAQYDILVEAYEQSEAVRKTRDFLYFARYAILPVANSHSAFARSYSEKGLDRDLIGQIFFHDLYAEKKKGQEINIPYTVYTRLQRAGVPIVFTHYFGFEQKDIKGKAIAGSDEHLFKALLRDTTAISYLPLTLIYDLHSGKPLTGLTVLPVDLNGNGRVSEDEKFYDQLSQVTQRFESKTEGDINNIPVAYLHFSVSKSNPDPGALEFLRWVIANGQADLHHFGYLNPEPSRLQKEKFGHLSLKN